MINLDMMKDEFESNELVKDTNIKSLELKLDNMIKRVAELMKI